MNAPILTTQNTNKRYRIAQVLGSLVINFGIGFYLITRADILQAHRYYDEAGSLLLAGFAFFIAGILSIIYNIMVSSTYVNIYDGVVEGKAMQKISVQTINLRFDQITDVSASRGFMNIQTANHEFLVINTAAGNYQILTTPDRAKEIVEFFKQVQGKA